MKKKVKCWQCDKINKINLNVINITSPYVEWKCECGFENNAYNVITKKNETSREIYNYHKLYEERLGLYNDALDYAIKVLKKQYKRTKNEYTKMDICFKQSSLENLKCDLEL
jgi:hypothetical protein